MLFARNVLTGFEGGITRQTKLYMAVATQSVKCSALSFVSVDNISASSNECNSLAVHTVIEKAKYPYTAICFDNFSGHIATLSDAGPVTFIDMECEKRCLEFIPDGAGVVDLDFSRCGKLFTIGRSARGQLQVWDVRASTGGRIYTNLATAKLPVSSYLRILPHFTQEHLCYCGDSSGNIHEVDLRTNGICSTYRVHSGGGKYFFFY